MIIVLDCNIWVTLTINGQIDFIADLSDSGNLIASCSELRYELGTVLQRPKFERFANKETIAKVLKLHDLVATTYNPGRIIKVTSDSKDDYLFALSAKAKADYLVTGDKLLLQVAKYKQTKVISLAQLRESLR